MGMQRIEQKGYFACDHHHLFDEDDFDALYW